MFAGGSENVTDPLGTLGVLGLGAGAGDGGGLAGVGAGAGAGVGAGLGLGAFVLGAQYGAGAGEYLDSDLLCPPLSAIATDATVANRTPRIYLDIPILHVVIKPLIDQRDTTIGKVYHVVINPFSLIPEFVNTDIESNLLHRALNLHEVVVIFHHLTVHHS